MTIKEAIVLGNKSLDNIETKILLKYVLNKDYSYIVANANKELNSEEEKTYITLLKKVNDGYPLQYITNKQQFMGEEFYVDKNVLIPQPDTEILVEKTIEIAKENKANKILDLCTGSGAIAISLKKYLPNIEVTASDISKKALEVANKNAKSLNTTINFIESDMFKNINDKFDIIVSNPPYIKTDVINTLDKDVKHEPIIALDGGSDGLKFYKAIRKDVEKYLKENGTVIMEIGFDQKEEVLNLFEGAICIKDYENRDRVVIWNHFQAK